MFNGTDLVRDLENGVVCENSVVFWTPSQEKNFAVLTNNERFHDASSDMIYSVMPYF